MIKQATKDTKMCFLNFKKSELGRNGTEIILHFLIFYQHYKDVNIGVKPSAVTVLLEHVTDVENKGHEKHIWHSYTTAYPK